jgi:alanine-glyoxylate transaminase/serine-glyoxylate transaminase/serine-pyruvate transaminase|tara:strand:- start:2151 stop:3362 length:1212 start_codon:yes stop_codon:yes gene_type:complete
MADAGRQFLHTPGPSPIPDRVLGAMHRQALDLVDPKLQNLTFSCYDDLKDILGTTGEMFIYACNGHGGWEAALTNLFSPGDLVVLPETGVFSNAWANHARAFGIEAELLAGDWRQAIDPAQLEARLKTDKQGRIKAVLAVHTDTGTGITSNIPALRAAIDAAGHPALLVVDTIASLAATPFAMDGWGVDVAIAASQKALMGPPGLAFVAANQKALDVAAKNPAPRQYWDWRSRLGEHFYMLFCGTAPEHGLFALRESLDMIKEQGLDAVFARHQRIAEATQLAVSHWAEGGALAFQAIKPEERSWSVTTIRVDPAQQPDRLRTYVRDSLNVALGGGLAALDGQAFRIGHLGDINEPMILGCLAAVETAMTVLDIPHGKGGLRAAVDHLAVALGRQARTSAAAE